MNRQMLSLVLRICLLGLAFLITPTNAQQYYYDGQTKVNIYISATQIINFAYDQQPLTKHATTTHLFSRAVALQRIPEHTSIESLRQQFPNLNASKTFGFTKNVTSPNNQAFPGGVIVIFKPQWDATRIYLWAQSNSLATPKVLIESLNMWMIATPAGVEALHTANRIHESQEVISATPDLWQPLATN